MQSLVEETYICTARSRSCRDRLRRNLKVSRASNSAPLGSSVSINNLTQCFVALRRGLWSHREGPRGQRPTPGRTDYCTASRRQRPTKDEEFSGKQRPLVATSRDTATFHARTSPSSERNPGVSKMEEAVMLAIAPSDSTQPRCRMRRNSPRPQVPWVVAVPPGRQQRSPSRSNAPLTQTCRTCRWIHKRDAQ